MTCSKCGKRPAGSRQHCPCPDCPPQVDFQQDAEDPRLGKVRTRAIPPTETPAPRWCNPCRIQFAAIKEESR